jgi:nitrogen regulatory protein P-II 1
LKLIQVVIKPFKLDDVKRALAEIGVAGLTATEIRGTGRAEGRAETHRGAAFASEFIPMVKLEIAVPDDQVAAVIEVVTEAGRAESMGDAKLLVVPLSSVVRIRTGERGDGAI